MSLKETYSVIKKIFNSYLLKSKLKLTSSICGIRKVLHPEYVFSVMIFLIHMIDTFPMIIVLQLETGTGTMFTRKNKNLKENMSKSDVIVGKNQMISDILQEYGYS